MQASYWNKFIIIILIYSNAFKRCLLAPQNYLSFQSRVKHLADALASDITSSWSYNDMFPRVMDIGMSDLRIGKSFANRGDRTKLQKIFAHALSGNEIVMPIIGGSISRGAPFSEDGSESRIYFYAINDWWNRVITPYTGSTLQIQSVSLGGAGTDYFSLCLNAHLPVDMKPKLILWELAANDKGRYEDKPFPPGQPLEQFIVNVMKRPSHPALLLLNFFRGHDYNGAGCPNYEDEGGTTVAKYYNLTSISWRDFVCENIRTKQPLFAMKEIFGSDDFHPSILAHAQMAFLVIYHLRAVFMSTLKLYAGRVTTMNDLSTYILSLREPMLPMALYRETVTDNTPECFTYFLYNSYKPNNTLPAVIIRQDDYHFNIFKQFKVREDKLGGMQTFLGEQLLQFQFNLDRSFARLYVASHSQSGNAQIWVDTDIPIIVKTMDYHMGTKIEIAATNLKPGQHTLNVLSLEGGFVVCAFAVI